MLFFLHFWFHFWFSFVLLWLNAAVIRDGNENTNQPSFHAVLDAFASSPYVTLLSNLKLSLFGPFPSFLPLFWGGGGGVGPATDLSDEGLFLRQTFVFLCF